jgi:hypothetical protein
MAILDEAQLERICGIFHALGTQETPAVVMRDLVDTLRAAWSENARLRLALRILAGLPDGAGHTHSAELDGRTAAYARGVLAGADAGDVAGAVAKGEG